MNKKHSKLNFKAVTIIDSDQEWNRKIVDDDLSDIVFMNSDSGPLDQANAEFIVKACNNYDNMLEALERGLSRLSMHAIHNDYYVIEEMKQAIKKAKG